MTVTTTTIAAHGLTIGDGHFSHRPSCAQRMLAALNGDPLGRADRGLEWRLVARVAPSEKFLVDAPIEVLEMAGRTRSALKKAGVESVKELARMTWQSGGRSPASARRGWARSGSP